MKIEKLNKWKVKIKNNKVYDFIFLYENINCIYMLCTCYFFCLRLLPLLYYLATSCSFSMNQLNQHLYSEKFPGSSSFTISCMFFIRDTEILKLLNKWSSMPYHYRFQRKSESWNVLNWCDFVEKITHICYFDKMHLVTSYCWYINTVQNYFL